MKGPKLILFASLPFFITTLYAQINGCTDPLASNYNVSATNNDGSCAYSILSIAPISTYTLNGTVSETSGLILWDDKLWTHNDNVDTAIYALDTVNGNIAQTYPLSGTFNKDWEEISQDDNYIYVGDFGNNTNGNRTDFKIFRISKNSILINSLAIDTIHFSYSNQTNFTSTGGNNTDFDCETFIVSSDSIFLFTKQWLSNGTSVYSLPKIPGTYVANLKYTFDVQGLIAGATYLESKRLVVLCGYSNTLQPFIYLLYDFTGYDFFSGNKRKINVSLPFHQTEGIATTDGLKYYVSNEYLNKPPISPIFQKVHIFTLNSYLQGYLSTITSTNAGLTIKNNFEIYPVPASDVIYIKTNKDFLHANYFITNQLGQIVLSGKISNEDYPINISDISEGVYVISIENKGRQTFKIIKSKF